MKTSLEWLSEFLPAGEGALASLDAQRCADALTGGGLPVETIETHGADTVIDVEVTSNRSDCLCHIGIARELSALLNRPMRSIEINAAESNEPASDALRARIDSPQLCPHYTARLIRGVKIGPSPQWMVRRLETVGIRPINNVVDVTNYVMFEMGQPLHAFDYSKIHGGQIIVRNAGRGESIVSIDGRKRELAETMLVIADADRAVALAGVMGGADSEVSANTVDVLLESARFDPLSIRRTARALTMKSDSSYRFERGVDPTLPARASLRAAQLIQQTAGGRLLRGVAEAGSGLRYTATKLSLRLGRLKQVLGIELPVGDVVAALARLSMSPVMQGDRVDVTAPPYRLDIGQEIDLVEEVIRVLGYDRIPTRDEIAIRLAPPDRDSITIDTICQTLVAGGYFEAVTFSFISDPLRGDFGAAPLRADAAVRKADAALRPSLVPGLLEAVRLNETNGVAGARLFEIGSTFALSLESKVDERRTVTLAGGGDVRDVRGVVEAVLRKLDANRIVHVLPDSRAGYAKGACGRIVWGDQTIGVLGRIDRAVADKLSLRELPVAAELELAALLSGDRHVPRLKDLPKFPAVRRDVSFILSESVAYEKVDSLVRGLALPFLEEIDFVTTYRGKPLEAGTKSVTITLVFRSPSATLTSEQVEASVLSAVAAAKEKLGAIVRA